MDRKSFPCTTVERDAYLTEDEDLTAAYKFTYFATYEKTMDCTVDQKPIDLSTHRLPGPIDLSTLKSKTSEQEEPSKLPGSYQALHLDVPKPLNLHVGTSCINTDTRLSPYSFEFQPRILSSPVGNDVPSMDIAVLGARLASPMTSPLSSSLSPKSVWTGLDSSVQDEQGASNRYSSSSRLFNVLAKQFIGDIDCPPRPGLRPRLSASSGEPLSKDENESDAAYRERRSKNNLAARRSRDKRKMKCDLLLQKTAAFKQQTIDILKDINNIQKVMLDKGFPQPLPFQENINFIRQVLDSVRA